MFLAEIKSKFFNWFIWKYDKYLVTGRLPGKFDMVSIERYLKSMSKWIEPELAVEKVKERAFKAEQTGCLIGTQKQVDVAVGRLEDDDDKRQHAAPYVSTLVLSCVHLSKHTILFAILFV